MPTTRCIEVQRSNSGAFQMIGAAEVEDWEDIEYVAEEIESYGGIRGWPEWDCLVRTMINGQERWFFAAVG